jgi:hypothetical protein
MKNKRHIIVLNKADVVPKRLHKVLIGPGLAAGWQHSVCAFMPTAGPVRFSSCFVYSMAAEWLRQQLAV